jgi:hypothetical protein
VADKEQSRKVLVKVSKLSEQELDKAFDDALDALFGPDEEEDTEEKPAVSDTSTKKERPVKSRKQK